MDFDVRRQLEFISSIANLLNNLKRASAKIAELLGPFISYQVLGGKVDFVSWCELWFLIPILVKCCSLSLLCIS